MDHSKSEEFVLLENRLKELITPVFIGEKWMQDHFKKPTLTPLQNAYKSFKSEPTVASFKVFENALILCKAAENTKISDINMPDIIKIAEQMLDSFPSKLNTKNSPR